MQVLRLGAPVTSLSLSPAMDMLATTHVEREGVYLWANQLVFGSGADVVPSEKPIDARLPSLRSGFVPGEEGDGGDVGAAGKARKGRRAATAAMLRHSAGPRAGEGDGDISESDAESEGAGALGDDTDEDSGSDLSDSEGEEAGEAAAAAGVNADPAAGAAYSRRDKTGAPVPLAPEMVTFSLLPRTQWLNLVHLDAIKERNKPTAAPEKPKAAPFFLPTLPSEAAGRQPVFDPSGGLLDADDEADAATRAAAAAAWGAGSDDDGEGDSDGASGSDGEDDALPGPSRVLRGATGGPSAGDRSRVVQLLHDCADAGDWTSLMAHLRGMAPAEVDRELRAMVLIEGDLEESERDVVLLFSFLEAEAASNSNFEFAQALLRATLAVHGEAVAARPAVAAAAARVEARLGATWRRLSTALQHARCMVGILGSLQA